MKKSILSIVLAALMTGTLLTGCGGGKTPKETAATTAATTAAKAETTAAAQSGKSDSAGEEAVSDETFSILQDNYALMVECYDAVRELYTSDEIAADGDIEEAMNMAADVINQMGEITQDSITEEDAVTLNDAIGDILDGLSAVVDGMEIAGGDGVSDETFNVLQTDYQAMVEAYNAVAEAYNNGGTANADIENTMNQAREIIEQMGQITQDNITEADAEELVSAMEDILSVLETVVNSLG